MIWNGTFEDSSLHILRFLMQLKTLFNITAAHINEHNSMKHSKKIDKHEFRERETFYDGNIFIRGTYQLQPFRHVANALKHVQLILHRCTLANYAHFYVISL